MPLRCKRYVYPSYFKLHVRWLSSLTPVTYLSKLLGICCVAAFLQLELFRVYTLLLLFPSTRKGEGLAAAADEATQAPAFHEGRHLMANFSRDLRLEAALHQGLRIFNFDMS